MKKIELTDIISYAKEKYGVTITATPSKDVDIFKEIIKIVENNNISLTIYGKNTILEKMNVKERKRARRS